VQLTSMLGRLSGLQADGENLTPLQSLLLRLSDQFPNDVGIFAPLMLNVLQASVSVSESVGSL
jgi:hypothetical protein